MHADYPIDTELRLSNHRSYDHWKVIPDVDSLPGDAVAYSCREKGIKSFYHSKSTRLVYLTAQEAVNVLGRDALGHDGDALKKRLESFFIITVEHQDVADSQQEMEQERAARDTYYGWTAMRGGGKKG